MYGYPTTTGWDDLLRARHYGQPAPEVAGPIVLRFCHTCGVSLSFPENAMIMKCDVGHDTAPVTIGPGRDGYKIGETEPQ